MPVPLLLGLGLAAGGATMKGINYFNARKDQRAAQSALDKESMIPYAQYAVTPEARQYYSQALNGTINPQGISGAERTAYQSGVDRSVNTMVSNATRGSGGNLSRYIIGALNPSIINSNNTMLAQDQAIKRGNQQSAFGRLAGAVSNIQSINDRNIQGEIQRKLMREQYLGQSVLQNKAFQTNTLDSIGSDLLGGGLMMGMGGYGGNRTSTGGRNPYLTASNTAPINGGYNPYFNGTA